MSLHITLKSHPKKKRGKIKPIKPSWFQIVKDEVLQREAMALRRNRNLLGKMMTKEEAEKLGFTVATHCYPWLAYKGPKHQPRESQHIRTPKWPHRED